MTAQSEPIFALADESALAEEYALKLLRDTEDHNADTYTEGQRLYHAFHQ